MYNIEMFGTYINIDLKSYLAFLPIKSLKFNKRIITTEADVSH